MNFEIAGVWPSNKGAVLMLEAIRARLSEEFPDAHFAVPLSWPPEARLALGLWGTPARSSRKPSIVSVLEAAPAATRRSIGVLAGREIDVLLDASGFGYGDHWGLPKLEERLARRLATWKKPGKKAILLPQALGPFEGPGMAEAFRDAMNYLDLAFVRDDVSERYVNAALRPEHERKLRRAPDFTNLLQPALPSRLKGLAGVSVVIPNEKLVSNQPGEAKADYLRFLSLVICRLREAGHEPIILNHEGPLDREIAAEVNALLDREVRVVEEASSLVTKSLIAAANLVISSRFHGLASALSSGVPALACGWSHKYVEIMSDYGCPEHLIDIGEPSMWSATIEDFLSRANQPEFRARISEKAAIQKAMSERMWDETLQVIRS